MILSFSREIPDPKTGGKKKSFFKEKIQGKAEFVKKHTFREGKRWKVGDKIHFWDMSPRLKGKVSPDPKPFNPPVGLSFNWCDEEANKLWQPSFNDKFYMADNQFPGTAMYVPIVSAVDYFFMNLYWFDFSEAWVVMELNFAGLQFKLHWDNDEKRVFKMQGDLDKLPIAQVSLNDGFTSLDDFFYFFWSQNKFSPYTMEGQIVHWAGRSYRDLMLAAEELKELI